MKTVSLPYSPHVGQQAVHESKARFKVLDCGRRWGKDRFSLMETGKKAFIMAAEKRPKSLVPRVHVWSVAPSFPMLRQTWNELKAFYEPTGLIAHKDEGELFIRFKNGVLWELKSADKPDSLVGVGLDILHVTEAARVKREAWAENLRPTLSSPGRGPGQCGKGLAIFNSTPKGRNWFYNDLWIKGRRQIRSKAGELIANPRFDPEWESWQFTTESNPYINPDEITAARRDLPTNVFLQEYMAEFLEDAAGVFVNVVNEDVMTGDFENPIPGRQYAVGVDVAYQQDWTVITVMDTETRRVVHWERMQSPLWAEQEPRIVWCAQHYNNAPIAIDRTGVGENAPEMLRGKLGYDHRVEGYFFTNQEKDRLITQLQMAFQVKSVHYPPDLELLRDELLAYEYTYTKTGRFHYSAPAGQHDDAVVSLALALEACNLGPYEVYDRSY